MNLQRLASRTRQAAQGLKLDSSRRRRMNNEINKLITNTYFKSIPLDKIDEILRKNGALLLQEDNTAWSGFLMGRDGRANLDIGDLESARSENRPATFYTPYTNAVLVLMWHKMEATGNYEITSYVS